MALKTKVKVGNITNLSDARYCAGMNVDMLGFKISEVDGQGISPVKFKEIINWISGPEFIWERPEGLNDKLQIENEIQLVEIPVSKISETNHDASYKFIVNIEANDWPSNRKELLDRKNQISYLLLTDSSRLSTGQFKNLVTEIAADFPVLLGVEIDQQLLDDYLSWPIAGIALNGSEETSPGIKDYDHLSAILEKLEVD